MTTYETKLRGARKRLVDALDHAREPNERSAIESALALVNRLIWPDGVPAAVSEAA